MITCTCDVCGYKGEMEKAYGGKGRTFKLPTRWLSMKHGIVCGVECYQVLKRTKGKPPCPSTSVKC